MGGEGEGEKGVSKKEKKKKKNIPRMIKSSQPNINLLHFFFKKCLNNFLVILKNLVNMKVAIPEFKYI